MYTRGLIPWNFAELAEAVPIARGRGTRTQAKILKQGHNKQGNLALRLLKLFMPNLTENALYPAYK